MAEIEFAFLAEYAKAQPDGTLTATGIGFDRIVAEPGKIVTVAIAGRIRVARDDTAVPMRVAVLGPDGGFSMSSEITLQVPDVHESERSGAIFAIAIGVPTVRTGVYTVTVLVGEKASPTLRFQVVEPPPTGAG